MLEDVELDLVDTTDKVAEFSQWLGERRDVLAVDTETSGLEPERCVLRLVQFGDEHRGWAIPWERWGGVALEVFDRYTGEFVFHNAKFDVRFIELHGGICLPRERIHDTMFMAHLLDPPGAHGLKPLAARLVDSKAAYASRALDEAMAQQKWTWATVPLDFPMYWAYGALDTVLTANVYSALKTQVRLSCDRVYEVERACTWILADMERRGARVDLEYTAMKRDELSRFTSAVANWCRKTHGIEPGSNKKVAERLVELGVQLDKRTATGALELSQDVILSILEASSLEDVLTENLDSGRQLAYQVLARRKAEKICAAYLDHFLTGADAEGRVHCNIRQVGARTGRMSIDNPPMQTLPRGAVVRDCFIPADGNVLLSADFDAVEMRLLAHFANDEALLAAIADPEVDIHTAMARALYRDPQLEKRDERRQIMKNVNFAKLYGAGTAKIALTAGVSLDQAKEFLDAYDQTFPGVRAFQRLVSKTGEERKEASGAAYVTTPLGRYQPAEDTKDYTLVNYLVQGTAADVLKEALVRLDEAGATDWMILPVHDEVLFDVPAADVDEARHLIATTMPDSRWRSSLSVSVDGPLARWGDHYR